MKRPRIWLRWLLFIGFLLVAGEYAALTWFAPQHVLRAVERVVGGSLFIGKARLSLPLTTTLTHVHLVNNTPESALTAQRVVLRPHWVSVPTKTLDVKTLDIERPVVRITRTKNGTWHWPSVTLLPAPVPSGARHMTVRQWWSSWQVHIESLKISDGVIELIDEMPASPFHALIDHLSLVVGPVTLPSRGLQTSFAIRGEVLGSGGAGAPLYCSGWVDVVARDLQASCQLEPLTLATFEPYFHGPIEVRAYSGTLKSTSQWIAKANELKSRIQVELDHLNEGDVSVHGRTIIDVKKLSGSGEPHLSGEFRLTGPLDNPRHWDGAFSPGEERAQQLIHKLLEHGVKIVKIPFGEYRFGVHIAPSSPGMQTYIEAGSREVQEALELLATPVPSEVVPPIVPAPHPEVSTEIPTGSTAAPVAPTSPLTPTTIPSGTPVTSSPTAETPSVLSPAPTPETAPPPAAQ